MDKNKILTVAIGVLLILSISLSYYFFFEDEEDIEVEGLSRPDIVFDRSLSQYWDIWNTGVMGYSKTTEFLMGHGFNVSQNNIPLEERVRMMGPGDILFLGPAISPPSNYSEEEVTEIVSFVEDGGHVIILGEHENIYGMLDFQNKLAKKFGVTFEDKTIKNTDENLGNEYWVQAKSDMFELEDISFYAPASLNYTDEADVLSTVEVTYDDGEKSNETLSVGLDVGKGRVVFMGDTHVLWNGKEDYGLEYGQNKEFFLSTLEYLIERNIKETTIDTDYDLFTGESFELTLYLNEDNKKVEYDITGGNISLIDERAGERVYRIEVEDDGYVRFRPSGEFYKYIYFLKPNENTKGTDILFDISHINRCVDKNPSGLMDLAMILRDQGYHVFAGSGKDYSNYEAVILASPLKEYNEEEIEVITGDVEKILLLGDFHTSIDARFLGVYRYIQNWEEMEYPLNDFGRELGIEFTHFTAVDGNLDSPFRPEINYKGNTSKLFYSCSLNLRGNFSTIDTSEDAWGEINPWETWRLSHGRYYDKDGPLQVVAWDDRVFASGDLSLLENQNIDDNRWMVKLISDWIGER